MPTGTLYICGLPIGNPEDISLRALHTLKSVDIIAAEDTRTAALTLSNWQIKKPFLSYEDHQEKTKKEKILELLLSGKNVALISEAGMPLISDPGYSLVKLCHEKNINIKIIPGPTALITALVGSGLPTDRFVFEGFLPAKSSQRISRLQELLPETRTLIFYEAPHRLIETLQDILKIFGNRKAFIARELTKKYEETLKGEINLLLEKIKQKKPQGEYVLIIAGGQKNTPQAKEYQKLVTLLREKLTAKEVADILEKSLGLAKNQIKKMLYQNDII